MALWSRIELTIASGPAIASPDIETFTLAREDASARKAGMIDRLLAKGAAAPPSRRIIPEIADSRHRSYLSVVYDDGAEEALKFVVSDAGENLLTLVGLVQKRSPTRSVKAKTKG